MSEGLTCPICKIGKVTMIMSTLDDEDGPLNQCDYCGNKIQFILQDEVEI